MDGFTILVHHGVRFKAHRFVAYAAEQAKSAAHDSPHDVRWFAKLHPLLLLSLLIIVPS
jgi:hypothetical protein